MPANTMKKVRQLYERIAQELESAATHSQVAAHHVEASDIARACAHGMAVTGHVRKAERMLGEIAEIHSGKARV
ncbi:MAG: hypothetical protein HYY18_09210 [Planctomycetes bacterium]|nr:hypothetical protein [Planctomycetota bacterium]